jgi:hypothetical protein
MLSQIRTRVLANRIYIIHYITLHYITLRYVTLRYVTLRYVTLRYITLRYVTLRYVTLRYFTLRYVTLHYITLHYKLHIDNKYYKIINLSLLWRVLACFYRIPQVSISLQVTSVYFRLAVSISGFNRISYNPITVPKFVSPLLKQKNNNVFESHDLELPVYIKLDRSGGATLTVKFKLKHAPPPLLC